MGNELRIETREELRVRVRRETVAEIVAALEDRRAEITPGRPGWVYLTEAIEIAKGAV